MPKRKREETATDNEKDSEPPPYRVVLAELEWIAKKDQKSCCALQEVFECTNPPKNQKDMWIGFPGQVYHALAVIDKAGEIIRQSTEMTERIVWTPQTGGSNEYSATTKPDKNGLYWFKKAQPYCLGSIFVTFECIDLSGCQSLERYIPIVAGKGFSPETNAPKNAISFLPKGSRLAYVWMRDTISVRIGNAGGMLSISRYLWSALGDDMRTLKVRRPPFKPSVSDMLFTSTQKNASNFAYKGDASVFCKFHAPAH